MNAEVDTTAEKFFEKSISAPVFSGLSSTLPGFKSSLSNPNLQATENKLR